MSGQWWPFGSNDRSVTARRRPGWTDEHTPGAQPYDVYARIEDPMGVLSIAFGRWEDRDDTKASRRSAGPRTRPWPRSTGCSAS